LREVAHSLLEGHALARPVVAVPELFRARAEHHFLYFRVRPSEIVMVRILHERMDPNTQMR